MLLYSLHIAKNIEFYIVTKLRYAQSDHKISDFIQSDISSNQGSAMKLGIWMNQKVVISGLQKLVHILTKRVILAQVINRYELKHNFTIIECFFKLHSTSIVCSICDLCVIYILKNSGKHTCPSSTGWKFNSFSRKPNLVYMVYFIVFLAAILNKTWYWLSRCPKRGEN